MAKSQVIIGVKGEVNLQDLDKGIAKLQAMKAEAAGGSAQFTRFGDSLLKLGGILAATFAVSKVTDFFKESVQAAMEDEKSLVALAKAMENVGLAQKNAAAEDLIRSMSLQYGIADDLLRPSFQRLVTATRDVEQSQRLLQTSMDISAAGYTDLESAAKALSAASMGNFTALQRLKLPLDANTIASKDFEGAVAQLNQTVGGQAAAAADTYQGRLNRITVAAGEAREAIGYALLQALDQTSQAFGGTDGATSAITSFGDQAADLIVGLGVLASKIGALKAPTDDAADSTQRMSEKYDSFFEAFNKNSNSGLAPIQGLVAGIQYLGDSFQAQDEAARGAASATVLAAQAASNSVPSFTDMTDGLAEVAAAAYEAAGSYMAFFESVVNKQRVQRDLANTSGTVSSAILEGVTKGADLTEAKLKEILKKAQAAVGKSASGGSGAMKEAGKQISLDLFAGISAGIKTASDPILTELSGAMDRVIASAKARDVAANTVDQMKSVAGAVSTQITDLLNSAQNSLEAAKTRASDWAKNMASTIASGFDLESSYKSSIGEDGKVSATKWIDAVNAEVAKFEWFGNVLAAVKANGGPNGQALSEYLASKGADVGGAMGQAMIDKGLVQTMADKMAAVQTQAAATANLLVPESLRAGVESAQATYDGLKAALGKDGPVRKAIMLLMDNLAEAMKRSTSIDVYITRHVTTIESMITSATGVRAAGATGAIVSQPTIALIGEAGPEAVVPLNRMPGASPLPNGTGGNTYNVNVSTGVGDPRAIGQQIVEYITRWENANGQRYARTA